MITNLTNYAEWCKIFDIIETWEIGQTDLYIIKTIENGSIKWVSGVAERFTNKLLDLINIRFNKLNKFYNDRCSKITDYFEFSKILITFKKELSFLKLLSNLNFLPSNLKEKLTQDIHDFAINVQKSLENGSKNDLTGEMRRIILGNRIDDI